MFGKREITLDEVAEAVVRFELDFEVSGKNLDFALEKLGNARAEHVLNKAVNNISEAETLLGKAKKSFENSRETLVAMRRKLREMCKAVVAGAKGDHARLAAQLEKESSAVAKENGEAIGRVLGLLLKSGDTTFLDALNEGVSTPVFRGYFLWRIGRVVYDDRVVDFGAMRAEFLRIGKERPAVGIPEKRARLDELQAISLAGLSDMERMEREAIEKARKRMTPTLPAKEAAKPEAMPKLIEKYTPDVLGRFMRRGCMKCARAVSPRIVRKLESGDYVLRCDCGAQNVIRLGAKPEWVGLLSGDKELRIVAAEVGPAVADMLR